MASGKAKPRHDKMWRLVLDGEIEVMDGSSIDVRAMTVGDSDKREMDDYARAAARATYEAALDPTTELYATRMSPVDAMERPDLLVIIKDSERFLLQRRVVSEIYPGEVKREINTVGDSIEQEQDEEKLKAETEIVRAKWVEDALDTLEEEYSDVDDEVLRTRVRKIIANNLATVAFSYAYQDYALYCGIRLPNGERFFGEVPKNAPEQIKDQALALYQEVDPYLFRPT